MMKKLLKVITAFGAFVGTFLIYHIIGSNFFLVDENNVLQAPSWYPILGISIAAVVTYFSIAGKNIDFQDWSSLFFKGKSKSENTSFCHFVPKRTKKKFKGTDEEIARTYLELAKKYSEKVNYSLTIVDFIININMVKDCLQRLAWYNEKKKIYMFPRPRDNFKQICDNMENTIRDFIGRATIQIKMYGENPLEETKNLIKKIENDKFFNEFMTEETLAYLRSFMPPEKKNFEANIFPLPTTSDRSSVPVKARDPLEVIRLMERRFEEQYQFAYKHLFNLHDCQKMYEQTVKEFDSIELPLAAQMRFEQLCAEYKEKFNITNPFVVVDAMDGHTFEQWCAELLRKNGFVNVEVTAGSGDQGVDVIAVKDGVRYAIQCKCYSSDLSNKPVQEVHTGKSIYRCQVGVVMTNRHFTLGAKEAAEATGVLLWDRDKLEELIANAKAGE